MIKIAKELKEEMQSYRKKPKATLKDIVLLLQCREDDRWGPVYKTRLYKKYSGEYCEYLELLALREKIIV